MLDLFTAIEKIFNMRRFKFLMENMDFLVTQVTIKFCISSVIFELYFVLILDLVIVLLFWKLFIQLYKVLLEIPKIYIVLSIVNRSEK